MQALWLGRIAQHRLEPGTSDGLAEQEARLWTAQANLKRVKPLARANAVSQKELDDAQGTVNAAAAAVEMAKADVQTAQLNLGYTTIEAPVTGVSSFARIQDGAYVNAQSGPLTYVAQIDPMWVDFSISEDEMLSLRRQMAEGSLRSPGEEKLEAEVVRTSTMRDEADRRLTEFRTRLEGRRAELEFNQALEIQRSLLPAEIPQIQGVEVAARWQPAREVSGD